LVGWAFTLLIGVGGINSIIKVWWVIIGWSDFTPLKDE
jgi:hypothetical protein